MMVLVKTSYRVFSAIEIMIVFLRHRPAPGVRAIRYHDARNVSPPDAKSPEI